MDIATTPKPPYYAVIFSSHRTAGDNGYGAMAERMEALAKQQSGYLGFEAARDGLGIAISYWRDLESIQAWKAHVEHAEAQRLGKEQWYSSYTTRIAKIEREYSSK